MSMSTREVGGDHVPCCSFAIVFASFGGSLFEPDSLPVEKAFTTNSLLLTYGAAELSLLAHFGVSSRVSNHDSLIRRNAHPFADPQDAFRVWFRLESLVTVCSMDEYDELYSSRSVTIGF